MKNLIIFVISIFLFSCTKSTASNKISPVSGFDLNRYMGKWYEIGRFEHSFEKGLQEVTAEYSLRNDGKVRVINSGYNETNAKRKTAEGYAVFAGVNTIGELKVTFFWPFFGIYRIAELDPDYQYSVVVSKGYDYLWILSRTPEMDQRKINDIVERLKNQGFDPTKIKWVRHNK